MRTLDDLILEAQPVESFQPFSKVVRGRRIILYGAGGLYTSFNEFVLKRLNLRPNMVVDQRFQHGDHPGEMSAESFFSRGWREFSSEDLVVICLGNRDLLKSVRERFHSLGFSDVRSAYDIYEYNLIYADADFSENPAARVQEQFGNPLVLLYP